MDLPNFLRFFKKSCLKMTQFERDYLAMSRIVLNCYRKLLLKFQT